MAKIPTPRSYSAVLSDMVDAFLAKFGLKQLRVGSPVLSILEAAAMSDVRSSQDIFDLLASTSLDRATETALDRIAADENMQRLTMAPSSGAVTIRDSRMTKISTRIYQGEAAPIAGSSIIRVKNAEEFPDPKKEPPSKCKIYIGRGTNNVEGPLTYTAIDFRYTHWELTLAPSPTTKFHNVGESVVLAQGGNRVINAGTVVRTAQSGSANPTEFSTLYSATIPDGEESVENVLIVARQAGEAGNVPQNTINSFASFPFPGASVLNPLPLSNGREAETDADLRERIKNVRQSRSRGTPLAIKTAVLGIVSPQENKRVVSASIVGRQNGATTLYVDDGTGYEERSSGIALDALNDLALGGEQYFQLSSRAIAKASVKSESLAPFALTTGSKLAVVVGGTLFEHTFLSADFRAISNASAYEVVASINGNSDLGFSARTADGGTAVVLFAKENTNEDIQVVGPQEGFDANDALLFPTGRADTLRLYKNDRLLTKDGQIAQIRSAPSSTWAALSGPQTITVAVDGTPAVTYTIADDDFVDANTKFSKVGKNTPEAWAAVLNAKIPGITASASSGAVVISSNSGRTSKAKVEILSGSLVTANMFDAATATGRANEYTLDRNTGQVRLETPLRSGDKLSAGSKSTRAFLESAEIKSVTLAADALMFFAVDGQAEVVKTGVNNATTFDLTYTSPAAKLTADSSVFGNVQAGDWLLVWDDALGSFKGQWRITAATGTELTVHCAETITPLSDVLLSSLGMAVVRFDGLIQKATVPAGSNYTASSVAKVLNDQLQGAAATVYRTKRVRVRTNTFGSNGSIAIVAANGPAATLGMVVASTSNQDSHLGSVEASGDALLVPSFTAFSASQSSNADSVKASSTAPLNYLVVGLGNGETHSSNKSGFVSSIKGITDGAMVLRDSAVSKWTVGDRFYAAAPFAISAQDDLIVVADSDVQTKRFAVQLWHEIKPTTSIYTHTNSFESTANGGQNLTKVFGSNYDFNDHAIYMRARAKVGGILYRYKRFGADGENARIKYAYPSLPSQGLVVETTPLSATDSSKTDIKIVLPSEASKRPASFNNATTFKYTRTAGASKPTVKVAVDSPLSFSGVVVGDLISFSSSAKVPDYLKGVTLKVSAVDSSANVLFIEAEADLPNTTEAETSWVATDISQINIFSLNSALCGVSAIKSAVNGLGDSCPVEATVLDVSAPAVTTSTSWTQLEDGINWVKTTTAPATVDDDYQFEFKKAVSSTLTNAGWQTEIARIVPITLKGLRNWLATPAISGLFGSCSIETSSFGHKLQLSTLTVGSEGSVQVQGGGANEARASVIGSSSASGSYATCSVRASDAASMQAGQWVAIDNTKPEPKGLADGTKIQSIAPDGVVTLTSDSPALRATQSDNVTVRFERQGMFVAVKGVTAGKVTEGGWVTVTGNDVSSANKGTFRVVRVDGSTLWIENEDAFEQAVSATLTYTTSSSLMVGDSVSFNVPSLGTTGKWTVKAVQDRAFTLDLPVGQSLEAKTGSITLGGGDISITAAAPARLIKRIHSIVPDSSQTATIKFDTSNDSAQISAGLGSVITVLNKLGFSNDASYGMDGYAYSLGLINEANRVVYGDPSDTANYPGVAAAGSVIDISGPIVKRATVALSIRARLGVSTSEVADKVKAAVATAINRSGIGQAIAISDIIKAASRISGVQAVVVLEPTYGAGNDLIPVQPYEKLLVLDVDQDITVTFVGD